MDAPTMRPASVVARLPTSRLSEAKADFRSASICAWACSMIRSASTWAFSRASCTIWAPCSRASSRIRAASCLALFSCSLYSASACNALALASSSSANSVRIASWRAVMALLIGVIRYFPKIQTRIANASRLTRKVPLGTRKLLAKGVTGGLARMLICQSCRTAGGSERLDSLAEDEDEQRHESQVDEVHAFDQRDRQEEDRLQPPLNPGMACHSLY